MDMGFEFIGFENDGIVARIILRRLREVGRLYLDDLMKTPDAVEGRKAFLEKRTPAWRQ